MSESLANADRRERLRKLALETIDLNKDPYFMRNHLGSYECKLCLTLHNNEGNYLAHTQGKRHQENLARRAAKEAKEQQYRPNEPTVVAARRVMKIGRPGYKVTKARDLSTRQRSLIFEIDYPQAEEDVQPRHRFMSAFEQRVDSAKEREWQYLLFACEPYETIGFKIPNVEIDKGEGRFFSSWDGKAKKFVLQLYFREGGQGGREGGGRRSRSGRRGMGWEDRRRGGGRRRGDDVWRWWWAAAAADASSSTAPTAAAAAAAVSVSAEFGEFWSASSSSSAGTTGWRVWWVWRRAASPSSSSSSSSSWVFLGGKEGGKEGGREGFVCMEGWNGWVGWEGKWEGGDA